MNLKVLLQLFSSFSKVVSSQTKGNAVGFVQILETLVNLLPLIHQVVLVVEKLFPNVASGAQKLDAALQMVMSLLPAAGVPTSTAAALQPVITTAINAVVAAGNVQGAALNPTEPSLANTPPSAG